MAPSNAPVGGEVSPDPRESGRARAPLNRWRGPRADAHLHAGRTAAARAAVSRRPPKSRRLESPRRRGGIADAEGKGPPMMPRPPWFDEQLDRAEDYDAPRRETPPPETEDPDQWRC